MNIEKKKRVAVVTGASSDIGEAIARELAGTEFRLSFWPADSNVLMSWPASLGTEQSRLKLT